MSDDDALGVTNGDVVGAIILVDESLRAVGSQQIIVRWIRFHAADRSGR